MKNKVVAVLALVLVLATTAGCRAKTDDSSTVSADSATPTESVTEIQTPAIDPNAMTVESVMTKGCMSVSQVEVKANFDGIEATEIMGTGSWKDLTFYIFDDVDSANTAFEYIKSNVLQDVDATENTAVGQRAEAVGLPYIQFYYVTGNMVIARDDFIGDPGSDKGPSDNQTTLNQQAHDNIVNFW